MDNKFHKLLKKYLTQPELANPPVGDVKAWETSVFISSHFDHTRSSFACMYLGEEDLREYAGLRVEVYAPKEDQNAAVGVISVSSGTQRPYIRVESDLYDMKPGDIPLTGTKTDRKLFACGVPIHLESDEWRISFDDLDGPYRFSFDSDRQSMKND
jgi:hypothetical protein